MLGRKSSSIFSQFCRVEKRTFPAFFWPDSAVTSHMTPFTRSIILCHRVNEFHTSNLVYKKKGKDSGPKLKEPKRKAIDDLLDVVLETNTEKSTILKSGETFFNPNSPVSKFLNMHNKGAGKNKKDKGKSKLIAITYAEVSQFLSIDQYWTESESILHNQQEYFINHITVRSASAIDELMIQFEGDSYPLREIADVSKKDQKQVIIDCSAIPQAAKEVMTVLQSKANMNLNPQQDGTRIYVPIPKVTKETRQKLVKSAHSMHTETTQKLKKLCNKYCSDLNNAHQGKTLPIMITDDEVRSCIDLLRAIEQNFVSMSKDMTSQKENDLMNMNK